MAVTSPKLNRTNTSIVEIIALVVIIVIVGWFFVRPQMSVLKMGRATLKEAQADFARVEQDKNDLSKLITKVKQSSSDLALVDEALPLSGRPTQLQVLLDSLVTATGMSTVSSTIQDFGDKIVAGNKALADNPYGYTRKLQTTTLDLTVNGTVDQFKNLLQLIESNGRVVDVETVDVSNTADSVNFKLKLKAYSYVP
jgi:Tfp pilus assembly protein PilO